MQILKLLRKHLAALFAVLALLVVQANAELALPSYMSEIVDVGIQQGGVASAVPDTIRAESLDDLTLFMDDSDAALVDGSYSQPDANGVRAYQGSKADAKEGGAVSEAMALPETVVLALDGGVDASVLAGPGAYGADGDAADGAPNGSTAAGGAPADAAGAASSETTPAAGAKLTMDVVRQGIAAGLIQRSQLVDAAHAMAESMGAMSGSLVSQRAIQFVKQEYEAQGIDLARVQSDYLGSTAALMFGLCLVGLTMSVLVGVIASRTAATIARDLRHETFSKVMRMSPAEVGRFSQASLITRCTNDIQQIQMVVTMLMRMVLLAPIMGIVAVGRVVATSTGLEWTIGVAVIAVAAVVGVLIGFTMPKFKAMQSLVDRVNLVAREMLDGLMPIRAFGRQAHELERFDQASGKLMETQLFTNRAMAFMMLVMNCVTVLIVWFGAHGVDEGIMQVGDMMAFISYTMQIVMAFMILTMVSVMLPRASVAANRVQEVVTCPLSITDPATPKLSAGDAPRGEVRFDNVAFRYPDADENVVSGVSFTTRAGCMTALIGSTGSGKSTLVQLIPRLYDATSGTVSLDGVDVRDWGLSELRRRIGYVPQQGMLFSGTVESNVKFAGDVSDEAAAEALRVSQSSDFVAEMPDGAQTAVAQGGSSVSGGQRQRLSIARALAKKPEVLVFDDSFSALDYATDARLREELSHSVRDAALVVVAQRIATIMHADEIIVLDEGRVVGRGRHEELLRSCPAYREIAESQLSAEELGLADEGCATERPGVGEAVAEVSETDDPDVRGGECR